MKSIFLALVLLYSIPSIANPYYKNLPVNFDDLPMFCMTWDSFDSDSKEQALEKFTISEKIDGVRAVTFNNAKEQFVCDETSYGLICEGEAYQINDDQLLRDVGEDQRFKAVVKLDYSKHRSDLIEGVGIVPSGLWGMNKTRDLYCEIQGKRIYN